MAKRSKKKQQNLPSRRLPRCLLQFDKIEFDAGHDGLLRGQPEASFVVGLFYINKQITLLSKKLLKNYPKSKFPCVENLPGEELKVSLPNNNKGHLLVLVVALEEDSGDEVNDLYKKLQLPEDFQAWSKEEEVPSPVSLRDTLAWPEDIAKAHPIHLMYNQRDLRDECKRDDFVGASLAKMSLPLTDEQVFRMRFVTSDQKNDWTLSIQMKLGG